MIRRRGILCVAFSLAGACAAWLWWTYDALVHEHERVEAASAQVRNVVQRRDELLPPLLEITRASLVHEGRILGVVSNARSDFASTASAAAGQSDLRPDSAVVLILSIGERYPELATDRRWAGLRHELLGTENRIALERERYNEAVRAYRARARRWPASVVTALAGLPDPPDPPAYLSN